MLTGFPIRHTSAIMKRATIPVVFIDGSLDPMEAIKTLPVFRGVAYNKHFVKLSSGTDVAHDVAFTTPTVLNGIQVSNAGTWHPKFSVGRFEIRNYWLKYDIEPEESWIRYLCVSEGGDIADAGEYVDLIYAPMMDLQQQTYQDPSIILDGVIRLAYSIWGEVEQVDRYTLKMPTAVAYDPDDAASSVDVSMTYGAGGTRPVVTAQLVDGTKSLAVASVDGDIIKLSNSIPVYSDITVLYLAKANNSLIYTGYYQEANNIHATASHLALDLNPRPGHFIQTAYETENENTDMSANGDMIEIYLIPSAVRRITSSSQTAWPSGSSIITDWGWDLARLKTTGSSPEDDWDDVEVTAMFNPAAIAYNIWVTLPSPKIITQIDLKAISYTSGNQSYAPTSVAVHYTTEPGNHSAAVLKKYGDITMPADTSNATLLTGTLTPANPQSIQEFRVSFMVPDSGWGNVSSIDSLTITYDEGSSAVVYYTPDDTSLADADKPVSFIRHRLVKNTSATAQVVTGDWWPMDNTFGTEATSLMAMMGNSDDDADPLSFSYMNNTAVEDILDIDLASRLPIAYFMYVKAQTDQHISLERLPLDTEATSPWGAPLEGEAVQASMLVKLDIPGDMLEDNDGYWTKEQAINKIISYMPPGVLPIVSFRDVAGTGTDLITSLPCVIENESFTEYSAGPTLDDWTLATTASGGATLIGDLAYLAGDDTSIILAGQTRDNGISVETGVGSVTQDFGTFAAPTFEAGEDYRLDVVYRVILNDATNGQVYFNLSDSEGNWWDEAADDWVAGSVDNVVFDEAGVTGWTTASFAFTTSETMVDNSLGSLMLGVTNETDLVDGDIRIQLDKLAIYKTS